MTHPKYGEQFKVTTASSTAPLSPTAVFQFLSCGIFKGVGPAVAKRIVDRFGNDTMSLFDAGVSGPVCIHSHLLELRLARLATSFVIGQCDHGRVLRTYVACGP